MVSVACCLTQIFPQELGRFYSALLLKNANQNLFKIWSH